jgi:hypothetical protein
LYCSTPYPSTDHHPNNRRDPIIVSHSSLLHFAPLPLFPSLSLSPRRPLFLELASGRVLNLGSRRSRGRPPESVKSGSSSVPAVSLLSLLCEGFLQSSLSFASCVSVNICSSLVSLSRSNTRCLWPNYFSYFLLVWAFLPPRNCFKPLASVRTCANCSKK